MITFEALKGNSCFLGYRYQKGKIRPRGYVHVTGMTFTPDEFRFIKKLVLPSHDKITGSALGVLVCVNRFRPKSDTQAPFT